MAPISINGSGTVTGISAGGLPDASIVTADIADANITAAKLSGAQTGSAPIYGCRAWVNFDGTGTIGTNMTIRGSGNVSSVYKNATGDYTINFTTAMPDANYVVVNTGGDTAAGTSGRNYNTSIAAKTTTTAEIISGLTSTGTVSDCPAIDVAIFR